MSFAPINADVRQVLVLSGSGGAGKQKGGGWEHLPSCTVCVWMCAHSQEVFHCTHPTVVLQDHRHRGECREAFIGITDKHRR